MIPYWSHHDRSGREGLSDTAWFRLTRIKTLAASDVGSESDLGTVWSWGWQTNPEWARSTRTSRGRPATT